MVSPCKSISGTLPTGDYGILGMENYAVVERKSLDDLVQCVGRERERFEKEVQRLLAYPVRALVVEGSWGDIENKKYRSQVHPNAVLGSIFSWIGRGLQVHMVDNHTKAGIHISRILFSAARQRWYETHQFLEHAISAEADSLELCQRSPDSQNLPRQAV